MGGYGALIFGLKYPHYFPSASSMSVVLTFLAHPDKRQISTIFGRQEDSIDTWMKNDLASFLPLNEVTSAMQFDIRVDDFALQDNRNFAAILQKHRIPFEYAEYPGRHSWY
jgi:S-formylglutathione hydrolase FrmB